MKFTFRLQKLMEVRKLEVDMAQRVFQEAKARELQEESKLVKMKNELSLAGEERYELQKTGGAVSESLRAIETYIWGQKIRINGQEKILAGLQKISEDKRLVLVETMKNLKTLEKLREKRFNEFRKEVQKRELKQLDELVVMGHGRRGIE